MPLKYSRSKHHTESSTRKSGTMHYYQCKVCSAIYVDERPFRKHKKIHYARNKAVNEQLDIGESNVGAAKQIEDQVLPNGLENGNKHLEKEEGDEESEGDDNDESSPSPPNGALGRHETERAESESDNENHQAVQWESMSPTSAGGTGLTVNCAILVQQVEENSVASSDQGQNGAPISPTFDVSNGCTTDMEVAPISSSDTDQRSTISGTDEGEAVTGDGEVPRAQSEIEIRHEPALTPDTGMRGDTGNVMDSTYSSDNNFDKNAEEEETLVNSNVEEEFRISPEVIEKTSRRIVTSGRTRGTDLRSKTRESCSSSDSPLDQLLPLRINNAIFEDTDDEHIQTNENTGPGTAGSFDCGVTVHAPHELCCGAETETKASTLLKTQESSQGNLITASGEPPSKRGRSLSTEELVIVQKEGNFTIGFLNDSPIRRKVPSHHNIVTSPVEALQQSSYEIKPTTESDKAVTCSTTAVLQEDNSFRPRRSGGSSQAPEDDRNTEIPNLYRPPGKAAEAPSSEALVSGAHTFEDDGNAQEQAIASIQDKDEVQIIEIVKLVKPKKKSKMVSWITKRKKIRKSGGRRSKHCSFCSIMINPDECGDPSTPPSTPRNVEIPPSCATCKPKYGHYRIIVKKNIMSTTKFACSLCDRDYTSRNGVYSHFHVHTGEKRVLIKQETEEEAGQADPDVHSRQNSMEPLENGTETMTDANPRESNVVASASGYNGQQRERRTSTASTSRNSGDSGLPIQKPDCGKNLRKRNSKISYKL